MDQDLEYEYICNSYDSYLRDIYRLPLLNQDQVVDLINCYRNGDMEARKLLAEGNLRLVVHIAKRYYSKLSFLDPLDVIQIGNYALLKAIDSYDFRQGKFSTYAGKAIQYGIDREIGYLEMEVSAHIYSAMKKYYSIMSKCEADGLPIPTDEELCSILGVNSATLEKARFALNIKKINIQKQVRFLSSSSDTFSLEELIGDEVDCIGDFLQGIDNQELIQWLRDFLTEKQFEAIYLQVISDYCFTDRELAYITGTAHQSWSQARDRAFTKLRNYYISKNTQV